MKAWMYLSLFLVAGVLFVAGLESPGEGPAGSGRVPNLSWSEIRDIYARAQELDEEMQEMWLFHARLRDIKEDLKQGRTKLSAAAAALHEATRNHHPRFLRMLPHQFGDIPVREQMARVLLIHLAREASGDGTPPEHLSAEVDCLLSELHLDEDEWDQ
jgi:hypothetical protein